MFTKTVIDKTKMQPQERSQGDGMETSLNSENALEKINTDIKGLVNPCLQNKPSTLSSSSVGKRKEPKFIPYEPYKAAVSPIITKNLEIRREKPNANIICNKKTISILPVNSLENKYINKNEENKDLILINPGTNLEQTKELTDVSWLAEKLVLENTIKQLREEKQEMETQFKIQTKVNSDLKKLLVASLGEDMQTKVQYMSEDKAKLGEHVLFYSQKLSQNNEELEKLSLQCDVWKSKAEASKLLLNELSAWKAVLSRKLNEATEGIQCLLEEQKDVFLQLEDSVWALHHIQEAFDPSAKRNSPCSESFWNLIQITGAIRGLSEEIQNRLLGRTMLKNIAQNHNINQGQTPGEQKARKVVSSLEKLPMLAEYEIKDRQKTNNESSICLYSPHVCSKEATVNCCKHCSGKVRLV